MSLGIRLGLGLSSGRRGILIPSAPVNTGLPAISGSTVEGSALTVVPGSWSGYPTPTKGYQWNAGGVAISGQTGQTLDSTGRSGQTITVTETATNSQGSASATSAGFGPIVAAIARILENGTARLLEDGTARILES